LIKIIIMRLVVFKISNNNFSLRPLQSSNNIANNTWTVIIQWIKVLFMHKNPLTWWHIRISTILIVVKYRSTQLQLLSDNIPSLIIDPIYHHIKIPSECLIRVLSLNKIIHKSSIQMQRCLPNNYKKMKR